MTDQEESGERGAGNDEGSHPSRVSRLFAGLRIVSLCTLLSRILGLVREMAMAALFGNGPVLDAFTVAFRIPNLARSLFGEGALSVAFLPLFVREQEQNGLDAANRLASAVFGWLAIGLTTVVAVAEVLLAGVLWLTSLSAETRLWLVLTAVMLPYLPLICLTAQIGAVLNARGRFAWPALLPVLFNVCSLAAIWWVQRSDMTAETQALWLAGFVVLTGLVQFVVGWPQLVRAGFRWHRDWSAVRDRVRELWRVMLPIVLGLSITQLNTLCDSLIALGFSRPETPARQAGDFTNENVSGTALAAGFSQSPTPAASAVPLKVSAIRLTPTARQDETPSDWRPLAAGTASALSQGQRLYQFPLGLLGVALGTVIFPLLIRHAERGDHQQLRDDLSLGLRLVFVVGLPASAGLWLLADPLAVLIFRHGQCTADDVRQTAEMIAAYGVGVWAFCGLLIVQRGYYAIGDRITPLKIGLFVLLVNLVLNLSLIWGIGARGLALSTSLCGILQFGLCLGLIQHRIGRLSWSSLASTALRALAATTVMTLLAAWVVNRFAATTQTSSGRLLQLGLTLFVSVASYALLAFLLRLDEFWMLLKRSKSGPSEYVPSEE